MMTGVRWLVLLVLLVTETGTSSRPDNQGIPQCGAAKVLYAPFDTSFSSRILLEVATDFPKPPRQTSADYSPQRTMWLAKVEPDYSREGPWTTTFYLGSNAGPDVLKLSLVDHGNGGAQLEWLNDKLVFGRVWWGSVYSTDFILDVQKRDFLYREMAHYGELVQPCQ